MPTVAATAVTAGADRVLRRPGYTAVLDYLVTWRDGARVAQLWWEVFGERVVSGAGRLSVFTWETSFAGRVHNELFPIDLALMDEIYFTSEEPIYEMPVPVIGYRIPWEVMPPEELPEYQQVVAECVGFVHTNPDDPFDGGDERDGVYVDWMAGEGREAALAWLAGLEAPLNGLADLARLALQEPTGNPFLDCPDDHAWAMSEYMLDCWYWTVTDILQLALLFDEVRDVAERIEAFVGWYKEQECGVADCRITGLLLEVGEALRQAQGEALRHGG